MELLKVKFSLFYYELQNFLMAAPNERSDALRSRSQAVQAPTAEESIKREKKHIKVFFPFP